MISSHNLVLRVFSPPCLLKSRDWIRDKFIVKMERGVLLYKFLLSIPIFFKWKFLASYHWLTSKTLCSPGCPYTCSSHGSVTQVVGITDLCPQVWLLRSHCYHQECMHHVLLISTPICSSRDFVCCLLMFLFPFEAGCPVTRAVFGAAV